MNNNQLNSLFTDFMQFNPYFRPFIEPSKINYARGLIITAINSVE